MIPITNPADESSVELGGVLIIVVIMVFMIMVINCFTRSLIQTHEISKHYKP